jgi:hypothetical protein
LKSEDFWTLTQQAAQKDPGFDLYWMAVALSRVIEFPDNIQRWPVEMVLEVKIQDLKKSFSDLSTKIMDKIKKSQK